MSLEVNNCEATLVMIAMQVFTLPEIRESQCGDLWSVSNGVPLKNVKAPPYVPPKLLAIKDLVVWCDGLPNTYSTTYRDPDTSEYALCVRCADDPYDIARATDLLVRTMMHAIASFWLGAGGDKVPLIWRRKPELEKWFGEITEFREDGPDVCPLTDRRCVRDMTVAYVKIYARFGADNLPSGSTVLRSESGGIPQGWKLVERIPRDAAIKIMKI